MPRALILILCGIPLFAQQPAFVAVYGSFSASTQPRPSGGFLWGSPPSASGLLGGFDVNTYQQPHRLATQIAAFGCIQAKQENIFLCGQAGGVTAASTDIASPQTTSGYAFGTNLVYGLPRPTGLVLRILLPRWISFGAITSNTGGTGPQFRLMWGLR